MLNRSLKTLKDRNDPKCPLFEPLDLFADFIFFLSLVTTVFVTAISDVEKIFLIARRYVNSSASRKLYTEVVVWIEL